MLIYLLKEQENEVLANIGAITLVLLVLITVLEITHTGIVAELPSWD
jgi:hypothetical protein